MWSRELSGLHYSSVFAFVSLQLVLMLVSARCFLFLFRRLNGGAAAVTLQPSSRMIFVRDTAGV